MKKINKICFIFLFAVFSAVIISSGKSYAACKHEYKVSVTEPTCVSEGYTTYLCSLCGSSYIDDVTEITEHNFVQISYVNPTCTNSGEIKYRCSICSDVLIRNVAKTSHNLITISAKEPTCTENGFTKSVICSLCGQVFEQSEAISALGHSFSSWSVVQKATCIQSEIAQRTCSRCLCIESKTISQAAGHNYGNEIILLEATCTQNGSAEYTCLTCGSKTTKELPALNHEFSSEWVIDKQNSCTESGSKSRHCVRCDEKTEITLIEPYNYHNYTESIIYPTCTEGGYTNYVCTRCGDEYKGNSTKSLGHLYSQWRTEKEAACAESGLKYRICLRCDSREEKTISATKNHEYSAGTVTKAATCTADGVMTYKCSVCGSSKTEKITKLGHTYSSEYTVDVKATCSQSGSKSKHCTICGAKTSVTKIKQTAHKTTSAVTKATTSKNGKIKSTCSVCKKVVSESIIYKIEKINLSASSFEYDAAAKTPTVTVKDSKGSSLKKGTDYTVTFPSPRKAIGSYSVKITFKNNYSGSKTLSFKIIPPKPTALKASSQTTSSITLTWKKSSGATGYNVYKYDSKSNNYVKAATVSSNKATINNLKASTTYKFIVKAVAKASNSTFQSVASNELTTATKPSKPNFALSSSLGSVTVKLKNITGVSGFEIYYCESKNGTYKKLADTTEASYSKKLTKGKTYYFKVRTYKIVESQKIYSNFSEVKSIKVKYVV